MDLPYLILAAVVAAVVTATVAAAIEANFEVAVAFVELISGKLIDQRPMSWHFQQAIDSVQNFERGYTIVVTFDCLYLMINLNTCLKSYFGHYFVAIVVFHASASCI